MTTPLPPTDPSATDDKLPGEAELAALYRQLPQKEPGPALDAAVLRAAAQALQNIDGQSPIERRKLPRESGDRLQPGPVSAMAARAIPSIDSAARTRRRRVPHWLVGLGSAASLVLVAGLAWHMRTATTEQPAQASRRAAPSPQVAASPAQDRLMADSAKAKPAALQADDAANQAKRQSMVRGAAGAVAPPAVSELAAKVPTSKIQPPMRSTWPASDKARAALTYAPAAPMTQPPPAPPLQEVSDAPVAAPPPAPPAPASPPVAAKATASTAPDAKDTPAQELDKIRQLFAQGHDDEARQRLRDFRLAHPQWPLSPALQAQLPRP